MTRHVICPMNFIPHPSFPFKTKTALAHQGTNWILAVVSGTGRVAAHCWTSCLLDTERYLIWLHSETEQQISDILHKRFSNRRHMEHSLSLWWWMRFLFCLGLSGVIMLWLIGRMRDCQIEICPIQLALYESCLVKAKQKSRENMKQWKGNSSPPCLMQS